MNRGPGQSTHEKGPAPSLGLPHVCHKLLVSPSVFMSIIAVTFDLACTHAIKPTPAVPPRECVSWKSLDASSKRSFTLASCSELDPETWDVDRGLGKPECTIEDIQLIGKREPGEELDSFAEVHSLADATRPPVTLRPEPRVREKMG